MTLLVRVLARLMAMGITGVDSHCVRLGEYEQTLHAILNDGGSWEIILRERIHSPVVALSPLPSTPLRLNAICMGSGNSFMAGTGGELQTMTITNSGDAFLRVYDIVSQHDSISCGSLQFIVMDTGEAIAFPVTISPSSSFVFGVRFSADSAVANGMDLGPGILESNLTIVHNIASDSSTNTLVTSTPFELSLHRSNVVLRVVKSQSMDFGVEMASLEIQLPLVQAMPSPVPIAIINQGDLEMRDFRSSSNGEFRQPVVIEGLPGLALSPNSTASLSLRFPEFVNERPGLIQGLINIHFNAAKV